jgi:phosphopantetheinyl transferase
LSEPNIYLFYCELNQLAEVQKSHLILNETDQKRYLGFKGKVRKQQFFMGRWVVKQALLELLGLPLTHAYELFEHRYWQVQQHSINISITHSGQYVAVALAFFPCALGLDIEQHKTRSFAELVVDFGTTTEQNMIIHHPQQTQRFYQLWTAKEAYFKATQLSFALVSQQNMAACLVQQKGEIGTHYFQTIELDNPHYSGCLISAQPFILKLCRLNFDKVLS